MSKKNCVKLSVNLLKGKFVTFVNIVTTLPQHLKQKTETIFSSKLNTFIDFFPTNPFRICNAAIKISVCGVPGFSLHSPNSYAFCNSKSVATLSPYVYPSVRMSVPPKVNLSQLGLMESQSSAPTSQVSAPVSSGSLYQRHSP